MPFVEFTYLTFTAFLNLFAQLLLITLLRLLAEFGEPMLSCTLMLPQEDEPLTDAYDIRDRLAHAVDVIIDGGWCGTEPTTVIDLCEMPPTVMRVGHGPLAPLGLC